MIQWPYLQSEDETAIVFAPQMSTSSACTRKIGGAQGWMWDYYNGNIIKEFWDCGGKEEVPFMEGATPFYFRTDWYILAHQVTLDCLKEKLATDDAAVWDTVDWVGDLLVRAEIESCFMSKMDDVGGSRLKCMCTVTNAEFMLGSVTEDNLPTHEMYGCFFDKLDDERRAAHNYHACRAYPQRSVTHSHAIQEQAAQVFRDRMTKSGVSDLAGRKTGALCFFLIKEGGPLTAAFLIVALWLLCLVVYPVVLIVLLVISLCLGDEYTQMQMRYKWFVVSKHLTWKLTCTCWDLSIRASSSFSIVGKLYKFVSVFGIGSMQINNSMVKDGRDQTTSIFNVTVNLTLIAFSEISIKGAQGAILWTSIIFSILNLTMIITLRQQILKLHTGFLKDINENRINKFEIALGLVKLMEDFLEKDVQFNFVQHFYNDKNRVRPQELDVYESSASVRKEWEEALMRKHKDGEKEEKVLDNLECAECLCCTNKMSSVDPSKPSLTGLHQYYPFIPPTLKSTFGHDGRYEFQDEDPSLLLETIGLDKASKYSDVEHEMSTPTPMLSDSMLGHYQPSFMPLVNYAG